MKTLLASVAVMVFALSIALNSGPAQASTDITLIPTPCTPTNFCYNVQNDAGITIDYIDYSAHYARLTMSTGGVLYDSGLWAAPTSLRHVPLYNPDGGVVYLTVTFYQVHKPCVRSGRATICPVIITLTGGLLELP